MEAQFSPSLVLHQLVARRSQLCGSSPSLISPIPPSRERRLVPKSQLNGTSPSLSHGFSLRRWLLRRCGNSVPGKTNKLEILSRACGTLAPSSETLFSKKGKGADPTQFLHRRFPRRYRHKSTCLLAATDRCTGDAALHVLLPSYQDAITADVKSTGCIVMEGRDRLPSVPARCSFQIFHFTVGSARREAP